MPGVFLALLAALGYGASQFVTQLGLRDGRVSSAQGLLVHLGAANAVLLVATAVVGVVDPFTLHAGGLFFFTAAGLFAPLAGRWVMIAAIGRVGATRTASLMMSESLFAAALGWVAFGQRLTATLTGGIVLIVVSCALLLNEAAGGGASERGGPVPSGHRSQRAVAGVLLGLLAGLFFALAGGLRQQGLELLPSALIGTTVGSLVALTVSAGTQIAGRRLAGAVAAPPRDLAYLALGGLLASGGMLAFFLALSVEAGLAVATALKNMAPLVTFALARTFLARREATTWRLAGLVTAVVLGGVLTAVGRG